MRKPAHPELYDVTDPVSFTGTRCRSCGTVFFPPLLIGCEVCGARDDQLDDAQFAARGCIHASAMVHMHRGRGTEAPFTVAEVVLDDGPVVRALMATDAEPVVGDRVEAAWFVTKIDDEGNEIVEPRFDVVG
jgi:uncharacterized OB-fold protein